MFSRHKTSAFEAITDGASAIRWVRAHAMELGVDPNRIAAGGGSSGERFCAQVRKHGDRCELIGYEGAGHGFFNSQRDDGKWYRETLLAADRFLTEIGYLRGR